MEEALKTLNKQQLEAVKTTEGYVRLIAGAGTGKTKTLTHRYAYIVEELGISVKNILSVTFTNKATQEMKKRIKLLIGEQESNLVNTYHGFCRLFLRDEIHYLNYPIDFGISDETDTETILKEIYKELNITYKDISYNRIIDYITEFKRNNIGYIDLLMDPNLTEIKKFLNNEKNKKNLEKYIYYKYLLKQKSAFLLDFSDLILFALYLLKNNEEVRTRWQNRIQYIQVDEFQDTSKNQFELVEILSQKHKNLFVVGDPDRTIYSWRGADVNLILQFNEIFENTKTLYLLDNYRSTKNIIESSNSLISKNRIRIDKNLLSLREDGNIPLYFHAKTTEEEAKWVVSNIKNLIENKNNPEEIVILYRSNFVSRIIETELIRAGISYIIYNGVEFYSRKEIKDALAYLKLLTKNDDLSFLRIVNEPKRGIGKVKTDFLKKYSEENNVSLYQALKTNIDNDLFKKTKAKEFIDVIEKYREINSFIDNDMEDLFFKENFKNDKIEETDKVHKISLLFDGILRDSGYEEYITNCGDQDRFDNIKELKGSIIRYEESIDEKFTLSFYLQEIALITDKERKKDSGCVKLMTIHSAKGLEFENVFVISLNEGIFPSARTTTKEALEEERRVCYVAFTRAKNNLYLSDAEGTNFNGSFRYPSRFLFNIDKKFVKWEVEIEKDLIKDAMNFIKTDENSKYCNLQKLEVNQEIEHKKFGKGIVKKICDDYYEIFFENLNDIRNISFTYFKE